jgi:beta-lactamase superfamily II metal-dependent hydrolase
MKQYFQTIIHRIAKRKAILVLVLILSLIMRASSGLNQTKAVIKNNNPTVLPKKTIQIVDLIETDAAKHNIDTPGVIAADNFIIATDNYTGHIRLLGHNDSNPKKTQALDAASLIQRNMAANNWDIVTFYGIMESCDYLVVPTAADCTKSLLALGYEQLSQEDDFSVFRFTTEQAALYKYQWLVTQHGNPDGNQMMFYTLQNPSGYLIVIDGGWPSDSQYVTDVITAMGAHVNVWFLTHPHEDHIGAFCEIYPHNSTLTIDTIYAVDMATPTLCMKNAPWDSTAIYEQFLKLNIPKLSYLHADDSVKIPNLSIQVFSAYDDYVDNISNDLINDGSMMLKMTAKEESMLFCSDIGKSLSNYLLKKYGEDLKADYIQMGHHGNGGLKKNFYQSINAKAAFFDAPDWLMFDNTGKYTTPANEALMKEQGSEIFSFSTAPNQIIIK